MKIYLLAPLVLFATCAMVIAQQEEPDLYLACSPANNSWWQEDQVVESYILGIGLTNWFEVKLLLDTDLTFPSSEILLMPAFHDTHYVARSLSSISLDIGEENKWTIDRITGTAQITGFTNSASEYLADCRLLASYEEVSGLIAEYNQRVQSARRQLFEERQF